MTTTQSSTSTLSDNQKKRLLRKLPKVDRILDAAKSDVSFPEAPSSLLTRCIRDSLGRLRERILSGGIEIAEQELAEAAVLQQVRERVREAMRPNLRRVVNATGIVIHTNLGRSQLAEEAVNNVSAIASSYSNLEYDLARGARGSRYSAVEEILCEISGAEAAMAVNNNAGAVLLCLDAVARGAQVIVSRGELVEIGGSFRIPDVMAKSGCILKEVGTTNRTHLQDYRDAIGADTGLLLKVHTSNYSVVGFTASVSLSELVELGAASGLPVMEDLGSGSFIDFSRHGFAREPTVQESVAAGADLVTFSGDKLLGGPQAGLIVGKAEIIERIRRNPLTRALRIDKMTLAALESTLRLYRDEEKALASIPTLNMLTLSLRDIEHRAETLARRLQDIGSPLLSVRIVERPSKAGGGSLPLLNLPSRCLAVRVENIGAASLERMLRSNDPPVIGRIEEELFLMDMRTVKEDEPDIIHAAFQHLLQRTER